PSSAARYPTRGMSRVSFIMSSSLRDAELLDGEMLILRIRKTASLPSWRILEAGTIDQAQLPALGGQHAATLLIRALIQNIIPWGGLAGVRGRPRGPSGLGTRPSPNPHQKMPDQCTDQ